MRNDPKNAAHVSSTMKKYLVKHHSDSIKKTTVEEAGDRPFVVIVDESRCAPKKENMASVIRHVHDAGGAEERFASLVHELEIHVGDVLTTNQV